MKPLIRFSVVTALATLLLWPSLHASPPTVTGPPKLKPSRQPVISPYMNLLNPNNSIQANYYLRTLPDVEWRAETARLDRNITTLDNRVTQDLRRASQSSNLGTSGHKAMFMSYGSYYAQPSRR